MIRWLKVRLAKMYMIEMMRSKEPIDEYFRQKWTHMQGILVTRGRMKWNWSKVIKRK